MAIIDICSFNGEYDLFKLRYEALKGVVDEFIIVEAPTTFSGQAKPIYSLESGNIFYDRFDQWSKVKMFIIDENWTPEEVQNAYNSKYTGGIERWMREYLQKESITKALTHLNDEDTIYIGDVDELWEHKEPNGIEKLKLHVYTYYLNMKSTEEFWGPIRAKYKDIKGKCLNDIRNNIEYRTPDYQGWHFTNMGGLEAVKKKAIDQYNQELFNGEFIKDGIEKRFGKEDIIGRDFKLFIEESNWPEYLKIHREEYSDLCK